MTTRRWMATVAVVAILLAVRIEVEKSGTLRSRYASALRAYQEYRSLYREGRVRLEDCVERSESLMEAQLALGATKEKRVTAIKAHIRRAGPLIEAVTSRPVGTGGRPASARAEPRALAERHRGGALVVSGAESHALR